MKRKNIGLVQIIIAACTIVYFIAPDMLVGPVDDVAVAALAGIVEAVLGVVNAVSKSKTEFVTDGGSNYDEFYGE